MAAPTQAEIETIFKNVVDLLEESRKFGAVNAKNVIAMEDVIVQSIEGDFTGALPGIAAGMRAGVAGILDSAAAILDPVIQEWGKFINAPETDIATILDRLFEFFVANSITVETRAFTFNPPSAGGGNAGTGTIIRLNKDADNFDIENQDVDAKTAIIVTDQNTGGVKNQESFQFRGTFAGIDSLEQEGVGEADNQSIQAVDSVTSIISNAGFDQRNGTDADPTGLPTWDVNDLTTGSAVTIDNTVMTFDATNIYLPKANDQQVRKALNLKRANTRLRQQFSKARIGLNTGVPIYAQVAWNRQVGSAAGVLTLRIGSKSVSVSMVAQTGYQLLSLPLDTNLWPENFNQADVEISIDLASGASGEVLLDDVIFTQWQDFNNGWYLPIPGVTPWLLDDIFTWSDTATESKIQRFIKLAYDFYLPHSGAPSIADPA